MPAVLHEFGDDFVQGLRGDAHEPARLGVVSVWFVQLLDKVGANRKIERENRQWNDNRAMYGGEIDLTAAPPDRSAPRGAGHMGSA